MKSVFVVSCLAIAPKRLSQDNNSIALSGEKCLHSMEYYIFVYLSLDLYKLPINRYQPKMRIDSEKLDEYWQQGVVTHKPLI